ncbi:MAG: DEAD/DEAH box helicase [Spirulina sp. SIO3F2]|nr:DEAD/DEAH box helicase [Spirulina sp. SIO3F2]
MPRLPKLTYDRGTLLLHPPPRNRSWMDWATWDDRVEKFRIPAMAYRDLLEGLQADNITILDEAKGFGPLALQPALTLTPYPHQQEALTAWKKNDRQGVIVLPTAAGKTYLAQLAIECTPRDTLIVVPTLDLMQQWYAQLEKAFPGTELGLLGGGSRDRTAILIATYNSAAIHAETLGNRYGLLIFDECHHLPTDFFRVIAEYAIAPYRLGLTATPERADEAHTDLDQLIGPILYRKSPDDLSGQALADHEVRQIKVTLTPEERSQYDEAIATRNNFLQASNIFLGSLNGWQQFVQASARSAAGRRAMLAHRQAKEIALGTTGKLRVLTEIFMEHYPTRILIFTNDNATVYRISQDFLIPALTHQTPVKERHEILRRFKAGDYGAIVASHVLNEGVDVPDAEIAVILSGTGSSREYIQRLGRVLRKSKQRHKQAILYEVVTEDTTEERTSARRRRQTQPQGQLELLPSYGFEQPTVPRAAEENRTEENWNS